MMHLKINYLNKSYYSTIFDNERIVVGFAIQPKDVVCYETIAQNIVCILKESNRDHIFADDIIRRLKSCPEYFKNNLTTSLFILIDSEVIEGSSIHSVREKDLIKVYYKEKPCVSFKRFSLSIWIKRILIFLFVLLFFLIVISIIDRNPFVHGEEMDRNEISVKDRDSSAEISFSKIDSINKQTNSFTEDTFDNIIHETNEELISTQSESISTNENNAVISNGSIHDYTKENTEEETSYSSPSINTTTQLFEELKQKGDASYTSYYNGNDNGRIEAIKYYKQALEIQYDKYIDIRLRKLQDIQ